MAAIDRDPCGSTMIRVSIEVRELLEKEKVIPREPLNDLIKRIITERRSIKQLLPTTQTKERMEKDMQNFVLNPDVPDTNPQHRAIYMQSHPEEFLSQDDLIHHINGNHDDNRIENLQKVTAKEHAILHRELNKNQG